MGTNKCTCKKCGAKVNLVSRIVGYFSTVSSWNSSKVEELKARRAGNYKI